MDVSKFMKGILHGREAQEATLEFLDSLSMYDKAKTVASLVAGLRAVRDEIVKHGNLVPIARQTDKDQRLWLKNSVRSYR